MTDKTALKKIHALLSGRKWGAETLDKVAEVVEATGRKVMPPRRKKRVSA